MRESFTPEIGNVMLLHESKNLSKAPEAVACCCKLRPSVDVEKCLMETGQNDIAYYPKRCSRVTDSGTQTLMMATPRDYP